jgi:hypothetical protein
MRRTIAFTLVAVCWAGTLHAQEPLGARSIFSKEALVRALPPDSSIGERQVDPRTNWDRVRDLRPSTEILLSTQDASNQRCRFLSADDTAVTVDMEGAGQAAVRVPREDVTQISRWVSHAGSVPGAIVGAGGGLLLGFFTAAGLAYKDCGGGCGDEQFLMGASLVGMPIAGAVLGYMLPGGKREIRTIYLKP